MSTRVNGREQSPLAAGNVSTTTRRRVHHRLSRNAVLALVAVRACCIGLVRRTMNTVTTMAAGIRAAVAAARNVFTADPTISQLSSRGTGGIAGRGRCVVLGSWAAQPPLAPPTQHGAQRRHAQCVPVHILLARSPTIFAQSSEPTGWAATTQGRPVFLRILAHYPPARRIDDLVVVLIARSQQPMQLLSQLSNNRSHDIIIREKCDIQLYL